MEYLLLAISILFALSNNILLHKHGGKEERSQTFLMNALISCIWLVVLLVLNKGLPNRSQTVVMFGLLYGLIQSAFLFFKMQAMATGPVALTTLIGNCSMIITTLLGAILWQEKITFLQGLGMALLALALLLCMSKSAGEKLSLKWILYCVGFFTSTGLVGIVFKAFSKTGVSEVEDMMMIAASVMVICNLVFSKCVSGPKGTAGLSKRDYLYVVLCGVVSFGYNRINIYLTGVMDSIIFFPTFNGLVIILSLLFGFLLFREKITLKQAVGFGVGGLAILLTGNIIFKKCSFP